MFFEGWNPTAPTQGQGQRAWFLLCWQWQLVSHHQPPTTAAAVLGADVTPSAAHLVAASHPPVLPGFTDEMMQHLVALLKPPTTPESLVGKASLHTLSWLIDSGASHHMTVVSVHSPRFSISHPLLWGFLMDYKLMLPRRTIFLWEAAPSPQCSLCSQFSSQPYFCGPINS